MKHVTLFILSAAFICNAVFASNPETIQESISKEITYPSFAQKEKIEGVVLVSFFVNNDGLINIELANASNDDLKEYVVGKLKSMLLPNAQDSTSKYNMRFVFRLI